MRDFYHFFPVESLSPSISSPKKIIKKKDFSSGTSEDSPHPSSSNKRRMLEDGEVEILEKMPLDEYGRRIKETIDGFGLIIDLKTIHHAKKIKYLFGANENDEKKSQDQLREENRLYDKIIKNFKPIFKKNPEGERDWNVPGWAWPELYLDPEKTIKAHFTIQMHKNGRFIIPTRRGMNIKEFLREFTLIFIQFLTKEEIEKIFDYLKLDMGKGEFLHLANRITPDEKVEELLHGSKIWIEYYDWLGEWKCKAYVDKSKGYEVETEAWTPENENLNEMLKKPLATVGSLREISNNIQSLKETSSEIQVGQNTIYHGIKENGQVLLQVQKEMIPRQEMQGEFSEVIQTIENFRTGSKIRHIHIIKEIEKDYKLRLKELKNLKDLGENLNSTINSESEIIQDNIKNKIEEGNTDVINGVGSIIDSKHKENENNLKKIENKLDNLNKKMNDIKELIKKLTGITKDTIIDKMDLIIKNISQLPGLTAKELLNMKKLDISKSTLYYYIKKLQDQDLISLEKNRFNYGPGRPSKIITLSKKFKNLIKNLKK